MFHKKFEIKIIERDVPWLAPKGNELMPLKGIHFLSYGGCEPRTPLNTAQSFLAPLRRKTTAIIAIAMVPVQLSRVNLRLGLGLEPQPSAHIWQRWPPPYLSSSE